MRTALGIAAFFLVAALLVVAVAGAAQRDGVADEPGVAETSTAAGAPPACQPIDCPPTPQPPTLAVCQADACVCAQQLTCFLAQQDLDDWPLFPQSVEAHLNTGATHGRYVSTRVNDAALAAATKQIADPVVPADLPSGSLLVKQNYLPDPENPSQPDLDSVFLTVMYKLDGYCPQGSRQANGDCAGGDWFWSLQRFGGFPFVGKPSFCLDCHGAVAGDNGGDWSWQLELFRRFPNSETQEAAR